MKKFLDESALKKFEDAVTEIEKSTSAEIVIAISRLSESYRDISLIFGSVLAIIPLVFILVAPWEFHYMLILPLMVIFFFAGYFISKNNFSLMNILAGASRKNIHVKKAARLAFHEEHVSATKDRTGILFYISLFEKQVEIIPDLGIDGKISRAEWNKLSRELTEAMNEDNPVEKFSEKILKAIPLLNETFPPGEDNPDEIPNRPRVRD